MPNKIATKTSFKSGQNHTFWKGGTSNYWRREARKIVNCPKEMIVHHIDGNWKNNKIENLQVITQNEHVIIHNKQRKGNIKEKGIFRVKLSKVISLKREGFSYKQIAQKLNINERMIKKCIVYSNKHKEAK